MNAQTQRCDTCGGAWFTTDRLALSTTGQVLACATPLRCADCGTPLDAENAAASRHGTPDARSATRQKARAVADAAPGVWVRWKTYPPDQLSTARVAASDLRTGKIQTLTEIAGGVEARTVRLPDGWIGVEATRKPMTP